MNYTIGNWTVVSQTTDTTSTPKTLSITDLSYDKDFTVATTSNEELILHNMTGKALSTAESIRYARTNVADVYKNSNVPATSRLAAKQGVRTLCEVQLELKATNNVSGAEVTIPAKGWICIQIPTAAMVTPEAVEYVLGRTIAAAFNKGATDENRIVELVRGDLNPM